MIRHGGSNPPGSIFVCDGFSIGPRGQYCRGAGERGSGAARWRMRLKIHATRVAPCHRSRLALKQTSLRWAWCCRVTGSGTEDHLNLIDFGGPVERGSGIRIGDFNATFAGWARGR